MILEASKINNQAKLKYVYLTMKTNTTKRMMMATAAVFLLVLYHPTSASTRILGRSNHKRHRVLKYIWQDISDSDGQGRQRSRKKTEGGVLSGATSTLREMTNAFKQAVTRDNHKDEKSVHVGNLLMAMKKMEIHMRANGMSQTANDLKGNHDKVLRLYNAAPPEKRDSVIELLKWELSTGVHGDFDPRSTSAIKVKNNSGAMGMMWLQHSVKYQFDCMKLMLEKGYEPLKAAKLAFEKDLEPHMDCLSSRLVKAAIPRMTPPSQREFLFMIGGMDNSCGPNAEEAIRQDVHSMLGVWNDLLDSWSPAFDQLRLRDI
jgi:hypothetical protein